MPSDISVQRNPLKGGKMKRIKARFDGNVFVPENKEDLPTELRKDQEVIVNVETENRMQEALDKLFGILDEENYQDFMEALKDCERVDHNGW
jgi:hypothetical protein